METQAVNIDTAMTEVLRDLLAPAAELEKIRRKDMITPQEVEALYGLNAQTLRNMRGQGRGPQYIQEYKGAPVFYEHAAIQAYKAKCRKRTND